jgi:hypothetical protein
MTDAPEPRRCAGCGAVEGDRQVLKAKTDKKPAVFGAVVLHDTKIADWSRKLCPKCRRHAARLIDRLTEQHLTT